MPDPKLAAVIGMMYDPKKKRTHAETKMKDFETPDLDDAALHWPRASDKTFVETAPFRGAWVASATDERLFRMIKGFHEAGDLLVFESNAEPHRALNLLFPLIFSYRQSLELRLKYLIMAYGPLANEAPDFRKHGLRELFAKCRRIISFFDTKLGDADREALDAVQARITEFDAIDPGSDAFRFAHDSKGQPIKPAASEIDLPNLKTVVSSIHNFLECVDLQFQHGYGITPCQY